MIPQTIGRYQIKSELGRGGMAVVYRAYDPNIDREVALKLLPREFSNDPNFLSRFQREVRTIGKLENPAVVPIYDTGEANGQPFLVMRLMQGGSLQDRLKRGALSFHEATDLFNRLAPALDEAHSKGIIHRDLKPDNILLDGQGNPYLSDFGIVKLMEATSLNTHGPIGTPVYMSPEHYKEKVSPQSDIYAMGVILFHMLTGQYPFSAKTPPQWMKAHMMEPIPNIREVKPDLPPALTSIIETAMAKKEVDRYSTVGEMAQTLKEAGSQEEFIPTRPSKLDTQPPLPPFSESAPVTSGVSPMLAAGSGAAVAFLILTCLTLIVFSSFFGSSGEQPTEVAGEVTSTEPQATSEEVEATSEEVEATPEEVEATPEEVEVTSTEAVTPAKEATATPVAKVEELFPTNTPDTESTAPTLEPKPQVVADSKADFSATLTDWAYFWGPPGSNNWTAMQVYNGNHYGKPCWHTYPNYVRTCNDFGNPGNGDDIAWRWRSSVTGPMEIQIQASKASNEGDGVIISVYQGGTDTFPVMQQATQYEPINQILLLDELSEGEFIFFVMNKNGSETLDDTNFYAKICHYECP